MPWFITPLRPLVMRTTNHSLQDRQLLADPLAKERRFCGELGLLTPAGRVIWRALGIWDTPS